MGVALYTHPTHKILIRQLLPLQKTQTRMSSYSYSGSSSHRSGDYRRNRQEEYGSIPSHRGHTSSNAYTTTPGYTHNDNYLVVPPLSSRSRADTINHPYGAGDNRRRSSDAQRSDANYPLNTGHSFMVFDREIRQVTEESTRPQGILRPHIVCYDGGDPRKPYKCADCQKGFDRPSALETHMTTHTKEQPFPCPRPDCDKSFSVKSNMTRHLKTVHQDGGPSDASRTRRTSVNSHTTRGSSSDRSLSPYGYYPSSERSHY